MSKGRCEDCRHYRPDQNDTRTGLCLGILVPLTDSIRADGSHTQVVVERTMASMKACDFYSPLP